MMKKIKKLLSVSLAVIMALSMFTVCSFAASTALSVDFDEANVGEPFKIKLTVNDAESLISADFKILYDAEYFKFVSIESVDKSHISIGLGDVVYEGMVTWSIIYAGAYSGDSTFAELTLEPLKTGTTEINVSTYGWDGKNAPESISATVSVGGHMHVYESIVVAPNCLENGYTLYTCECGESYKSDVTYFHEHSHTDNNGDFFCDICSVCSLKYEYNSSGITLTDFLCENMSHLYENTDLTIPDMIDGSTVTAIGDVLFSVNGFIKNISIPDTVESIGRKAFFDCPQMTEITIPASVTSIGEMAVGYGNGAEADEVRDDFVIYGYGGTAAEIYAKLNSIKFVDLDNIVLEPIEFKENTFNADDNCAVAVFEGCTCADISDAILNDYFKITDVNGNELAADAVAGTGTVIRILDAEGKSLAKYQVVYRCDVDGNGKVNASDARCALRAAAKLDTLEGVYYTAADYDNDTKVTASDARMILRKSAGLEK